MIRCFPLFLMLFPPWVAIAAPKQRDGGWAIGKAPYRVVLRGGDAPEIPESGWKIRLPDFGAGRADMRDVVLLGNDGKEIGLDGIWRRAGDSLLLLAESMPKDGGAATLYFGGDSSRRMRSWTARRSLMLETRRMPPGADVTTFRGWQEAWKRAPVVDGIGFVPLIFQGENPYGDSDHFLSRYSGTLKTGKGGSVSFYTLSDDVSYVTINGRPSLSWPHDQPPPRNPEKVRLAGVRLPSGTVGVDYCHAATNEPAAMVLGWDQGGNLGSVPPGAWAHPGTTRPAAFESEDGTPVPLGSLVAERYIGYGGEWYVRITGGIADPGDGWQVEWQWPDGHLGQGPQLHRLWMSTRPVRVVLRLRKDGRVIEGRRMLVIPRQMDQASVNNERQIEPFLEWLAEEDPSGLEEPARRAGFVLANGFLTQEAAARWAEAWLEVAKPTAGPWVAAMKVAIRESGRHDPKAALERLLTLDPAARAALGGAADLLELDLRVFGLKDPGIVGLAAKLRERGDKRVSALAAIRLGDCYLLDGRVDDAARCFAEAVPVSAEAAAKAPVIDRSYSLALEGLIAGKHIEEARAKLEAWELLRPAARIEGDQLLWRARVLQLAGDWKRALQDLETNLKVRPGAPEEIDVRFWQGRALFELGRKDEAREIWNALIKDYPKHERAEAARLWAEKS